MSLLSEVSKTMGVFDEVVTHGIRPEVVVNVSSFTYNFANDATAGAVGAINLAIYPPIPAHSVVSRLVTNCTATVTGTTGGTVSLGLVSAGDILGDTAIAATNFAIGGVALNISPCVVTSVGATNVDSVIWTVKVHPVTAGIVTGYISWFGL